MHVYPSDACAPHGWAAATDGPRGPRGPGKPWEQGREWRSVTLHALGEPGRPAVTAPRSSRPLCLLQPLPWSALEAARAPHAWLHLASARPKT